jgi:hypothetical protein
MRRTVVWSAALVVVLIVLEVGEYSAAAGSGVTPARTWAHQAASTGIELPPDAIYLDVSVAFGVAEINAKPPPGGISRDRAIAIAVAYMGTTANHVESAVFGTFSQFAAGVSTSYSAPDGTQINSSPNELVWAVTVSGTWQTPCPAPGNCGPAHHEKLLLDFRSGAPLLGIDRK